MLYATPRQRWCVNFRFFMYSWYAAGVFMCTHGTLLVCHVQVGVGLGWGCNHVSGSFTHAVCYATATLVCELSVFYVFMVRCNSCNSSRIERDNCCQRERSGGKDIPPIRNRMHQVKLHQTACRQIVSNGYAVDYRRLQIFPPDLAKKTDVWTWSKHSMINCI